MIHLSCQASTNHPYFLSYIIGNKLTDYEQRINQQFLKIYLELTFELLNDE
jgi:hypothetical protein